MCDEKIAGGGDAARGCGVCCGGREHYGDLAGSHRTGASLGDEKWEKLPVDNQRADGIVVEAGHGERLRCAYGSQRCVGEGEVARVGDRWRIYADHLER